MAAINHNEKTVSTVCQADDEEKVRVALQEILDANPGYTVVLVVEDAEGNQTTHTDLSSAPTPTRRRRAGSEVIVEEPPVVVETETDETSTDDGDEEASDEEE